jgi:hypothetical protein
LTFISNVTRILFGITFVIWSFSQNIKQPWNLSSLSAHFKMRNIWWNNFTHGLFQDQQHLIPLCKGRNICYKLIAVGSCYGKNFKDCAIHWVSLQFLITRSPVFFYSQLTLFYPEFAQSLVKV